MKLTNWYKSIVESNVESPPERVWEGIQDELDIQLVWTKIDEGLGKPKKRLGIVYYAVAASLFLGVTVGSLWYFAQQIQPNVAVLSADITPVEQGNNPLGYVDEVHIPINIDNEPILLAENRLGIQPVDNSHSLNDIGIEENQENIETMRFVTPIEVGNVQPISIALESPKNIDQNSYDINIVDSKRALKSLYVGFTGHIANTWMLSNKTFQGLKTDEFTATNASFGKNFGFFVGTELSPKVGIKSELFIVSQSKQNYNEYLNGVYVTNNLELDYYTFTFQINYQFATKKHSHKLMLGGYTGFLHSAKQNISGETSSINNEYSNFDYGLILGYEYPISLGRGLTFSPGLSTKVGLTNVFSGNDVIPYYLNRTQNASINLTFSLSYSIF
jgi:hypothetical protein